MAGDSALIWINSESLRRRAHGSPGPLPGQRLLNAGPKTLGHSRETAAPWRRSRQPRIWNSRGVRSMSAPPRVTFSYQ
jgi:hypothetical protein